MKKFDWFSLFLVIAITENVICFIIQGGALAVFGVILGAFWLSIACIAYWGRKLKQRARKLDAMARQQDLSGSEILGVNLTPEQLTEAYSRVHPQGIGDVGCKNNARSSYLRCTINPSGACQGCKDYEKL